MSLWVQIINIRPKKEKNGATAMSQIDQLKRLNDKSCFRFGHKVALAAHWLHTKSSPFALQHKYTVKNFKHILLQVYL